MKKKKQKIHFLAEVLRNPVHPITVKVVGVGGNGTHVLEGLTKINSALLNIGHIGINVTAYDYDDIQQPNIGRQMFYTSDIGQNKAEVMIKRINRTFGWNWESEKRSFMREDFKNYCNILITCVDHGKDRADIGKWFGEILSGNGSNQGREDCDKVLYWLDMGNTKDSGQVILGSTTIAQPESNYPTESKLKTVFDFYPNIADNDLNEDDGPSCSTMQALNKQSLFINHTIAGFACTLLWELLHELQISYQGLYYNGESKLIAPIEL